MGQISHLKFNFKEFPVKKIDDLFQENSPVLKNSWLHACFTTSFSGRLQRPLWNLVEHLQGSFFLRKNLMALSCQLFSGKRSVADVRLGCRGLSKGLKH